MSLTILLDCDGVLSDLVGKVCYELTYAFGKRRHPSEITEFEFAKTLNAEEIRFVDYLASEDGFCGGLEWYPGARPFLRSVLKLGEVLVVTSPWKSRSWDRERREWLEPHIPPHDVLSVASARKPYVRGDVLVEDNLDTAERWAAANPGGRALVLNRPWNQGSTCLSTRVHSYDEILSLIKGFSETTT